MKNEKFLFNIQKKCGDIANKILNAANDAEQTFKCKWRKDIGLNTAHYFVMKKPNKK